MCGFVAGIEEDADEGFLAVKVESDQYHTYHDGSSRNYSSPGHLPAPFALSQGLGGDTAAIFVQTSSR